MDEKTNNTSLIKTSDSSLMAYETFAKRGLELLAHRKPTIVLLNDNSIILGFLERILNQKRDYNVITADDSAKALTILNESPVDLLVQDLMRPDLDGFELYWLLKSQNAFAEIPILIFSAAGPKRRRRTYWNANPKIELEFGDAEEDLKKITVDEYLQAPANPDEILRLIDHVLNAHASLSERRPDADSDRKLMDLEGIINVPSQFPTIAAAVKAAGAGDTIVVAPGEYDEAVVVDKAVSILGDGDKVFVTAKNETEPAIKVEASFEMVKIENILFKGKGRVFEPHPILIQNSIVEIKNCQFAQFDIDHEVLNGYLDQLEHEDDYWNSYESRNCVLVEGRLSRAKVTSCRFDDCENAIDVRGGSVEIDTCQFRCNIATMASNGTVVSKGNFITSETGFFLNKQARLQSEFDTFFRGEKEGALVGSSDASVAIFSHATVIASNILSIAIGENLVGWTKQGYLVWESPRISFSNSILKIKYGTHMQLRFAASANEVDDYKIGIPPCDVILEDVLELKGQNWYFLPPSLNYSHAGAKMNLTLSKDKIQITPDSPAWKAASDGLHLGAWQGE